MGLLRYLKKTMFRTQGTSTPVDKQIHRGGDEVAARGGTQVRELVVAAAGGGAFEGVIFEPLLALVGAPVGVEVVQTDGHIVGVAVAGAEDDGLLLGTAGLQEVFEQVPAHGQDAVGQEDAVFVLGFLIEVFNLLRR